MHEYRGLSSVPKLKYSSHSQLRLGFGEGIKLAETQIILLFSFNKTYCWWHLVQ